MKSSTRKPDKRKKVADHNLYLSMRNEIDEWDFPPQPAGTLPLIELNTYQYRLIDVAGER